MAQFFQAKPNTKNVGKTLSVTTHSINASGVAIARYQNKPVFIEGALDEETVEIKLVEQKSKYSRAKLLAISKASPNRVQPICEHFKLCGGCDIQHLHTNQHMVFKQKNVADLFSRVGFENLPWQSAITSQPWHYRRKARIGVQYNKKGEAIIGFRQKGTNQLVAIKECHVLTPNLSKVFLVFKDICAQLSLSQSIGHIEVIESNVICVVIRQLKSLNNADLQLWQQVAIKYKWNIIIDDGNTLKPLCDTQNILPLTYDLVDESASKAWNIGFNADDFIQVNHDVNQKMVAQAIQWLALEPQDTVLDLFCGLGNFTLPIAHRVQKVVGVEGLQSMVDKAQNNAESNGLNNCEFYQTNLNDTWLNQPWTKYKYSKVLLDPARAGAKEALVQVVDLGVSHIAYVSCDASTLARDAQYLCEQGYKIEKISVMDMFSQTKHIETMVLFRL